MKCFLRQICEQGAKRSMIVDTLFPFVQRSKKKGIEKDNIGNKLVNEESEMRWKCNFAISKSWFKQWNALDKSVSRAPNARWLATVFFHLSNVQSKQCCVLNPFRKPHWNFEGILSKNVKSCLLDNFSNILNIIGIMIYQKETLVQVFSCEFCQISKNTFFTEHLRWLPL